MKRCFAIVLTLTIIFSFVACDSEGTKADQTCGSCGKNISATAFFCEHCGASVTDQTNKDKTPAPTPTHEEVVYSGNLEFYAALPDKSVCDGKIIEVTGEYTDKLVGIYYIGELDDFFVAVSFEEGEDAVSQFVEGDIITVRGECIKTKDDALALNFCELISVTKSEPTPTPTPAPTPTPTPKPTSTPTPTPTPVALAENEVMLPLSSSDIKYNYDNYKDAVTELKALGFTDIKTQVVYDLDASRWDSLKIEEIETISIAGQTYFKANTIFKKDASVVITYHALAADNPDIPKYSVSQLVADIESNALRAKETYQWKVVEITGVVGYIDSSGDFQLFPADNKWSYYRVVCDIQSSHKERVAKMSIGDVITVKGKIYLVGDIMGYAMEVYEIP